MHSIPRAENVGSLLQPPSLLEARAAGDAAALRRAEDAAVDAAIALQESVGLDVVTDGEMRRTSWISTVRYLEGLAPRTGLRSYPTSAAVNTDPSVEFPYVVERIRPVAGRQLGEEYPYLRAHASGRTKYTMPAPSYHRRYWSDEHSLGAYASCEEFLLDVRDWQRTVAEFLVAEGCDYLQLDAPNYGSLCDPATRAWHEAAGHDLDEQIAFDGALDSSIFSGLPAGVTGALHICRGNQSGGTWHSSGGYGAIADRLFPALDLDVLLLEYDTDRAGDFGPLAKVKPGQLAVLGLLTTKSSEIEPRDTIEARLAEAATLKPLEELALSTQCGFASASNAPMALEDERAKLELVASIAHAIWS